MSSSEWTPAVPGHTNELRRQPGGAGLADSTQAGLAADEALAEQVIDLQVKQRTAGVLTVQVRGEVDTLTTPLLTSYLAEQFESGPQMLVLDMSGVEFLGSSGLAALVKAREEAQRRDVKLRLVSASHAVLRPLAATGLADEFDTYPDLEAALA